jgi:hypothetical protein
VTIIVMLTVLAMFDCTLAGFRAAAGREGRIDKRRHFRRAMWLGACAGLAIVACNGALAAVLVATSADAAATWSALVAAGPTAVWVFGALRSR